MQALNGLKPANYGPQMAQGLTQGNPYAALMQGMAPGLSPGMNMIADASTWETNNAENKRQQAEFDETMRQIAEARKSRQNLIDLVSKRAQGTPGTEGTPAVNYGWNQPGGVKPVADDAAGGMNIPNQAGTPGTPGTPGDPNFQRLAPLLNMGAPEGMFNLASNMLLSSPQGQMDWKSFADGLNQKNPMKAIFLGLAQQGRTPTQDDISQAIDWELNNDDNAASRYSSWMAHGYSGGGSGSTTDPLVAQMDAGYAEFIKKTPQTVYDPRQKKYVQNPLWKSKEDWMRENYGGQVWARYSQAANTFGDDYSGPAGAAILQYGGLVNAIQNTAYDNSVPSSAIEDLVKKYNSKNNTGFTVNQFYWCIDNNKPITNANLQQAPKNYSPRR